MPKKRKVVVPKDNELFIPVFKPGDRFYRKNLGELLEATASDRCVYFNKRTGDDSKDGLTYENAVRTEQRLIQLLCEYEFDTVYCTKSIYNTEGDDDDAAISDITVDTNARYKWDRLIIKGDGLGIRVTFGTVPDIPEPTSPVNGFIEDVIIDTTGVVKVTGILKPSLYGIGLRINQTGHECAYRSEGVEFSDLYIDGNNYISQGRDLSLERTDIYVESVGDVSGTFYINYSGEAEQGYDLLRDRIGTISIKSEKNVTFYTNYSCSDKFIVDCKSYSTYYSLYATELIKINATDYIELNTIQIGTDKKCGNIVLSGGSNNGKLTLESVYPNYINSLSNNAWNCCPYINIDWDGLITHNGFIYCTSYNEKSLGHSSNSSDLEILVSAYDGWDDHIGWAPNYNGVNLEVKESATKFVGDNNGSGEEYGYLFVGSVASFIHVDGIYSKYSKLTIRAPYLTAHDQSMYFYSHFADINCDNIVAQSLFRVQPAMIAYADDESPTWNNSDYTILSEVHISAKVAMLQTGSNFDYCSNQDWFIECDRIQLMGASAKVLNIKADELVVASRIYANEIHFDIGNLTNATGNNICEIYGYSFESYDYKYHWSDVAVTNSTVNIKNLILTSNTLNNGVFGFQMSSSYPSVVRNLNLNIDIVTCSLDWSGGKYCPIIGSCSNYNGEISGEIGRIINSYNGQVQMVSPWNHDLILYTTFDPRSSNWNLNSSISLHLAERNALYNVYIDPDQGDDAFDGMTKNTAVKTIVGLYRYLKRNRMINYSHASTNYYLLVNPFLAIHMLSASNGGNRGVWNNPLSFTVNSSQVNDSSFNGTCELWFNYLEIIPEAPNLSAEFAYVHCMNVFSCLDFYQVKFIGLHSNAGIYVNASNWIQIDNSTSSPAWSYYNECQYGSSQALQRSTLMVLDAYDITITGMFCNVKANAKNQLYVYDSYGGSSHEDTNCCLTGYSSLKAGYSINLGRNTSFIGLSGRCSVESDGYLYTYIDTIKGEVDLISKLTPNHYSLGSSYMGGKLKLESNDNIELYTQSGYPSCFNGTGNYGSGSSYPGNYILIDAKNQISGSINQIFRSDLIVKCRLLGLGIMWIYGDGNSRAILDVNENQTQIGFYGYYQFFMKSKYSFQHISRGSGGPISESAPTTVVLDIDVMRAGISLPVRGAFGRTEITAKFLTDTSYAVSWNEDPTGINSSGPYVLNITVDHSTYTPVAPADQYTNYGKNAIPTNATGEILILNDRKNLVAGRGIAIEEVNEEVRIKATPDSPDIINKELTITGNTAEVELDNDKYNMIEDIKANITDLNIKIQPMQSRLQECGFEFQLEPNSRLANVTATMRGKLLPIISPSSFNSARIYQGTSVHSLVTIAEFEKVEITITNVQMTNQTANSIDIEVTGTNITSSLEYELELDTDGVISTINMTGTSITLTGDDFDTYIDSAYYAITPIIDGERFTQYVIKALIIEGRQYKTVRIGNQVWMAQNLADNSSGVWYDNDQTTYEPLGYGKLYTQSEAEAIANNVPGWHLPTKSDYEILVNTVGGVDQYNKLKSTSGWITDLNGTNESGFNSYPAGYGYNDGVRFGNVTEYSFLKTSSIGSDQDTHIFFQLCPSQDARFQSMSDLSKLSVRLVKDMSVNIGGRDYKVVQIGNQLWMAENLDWKYGCNIGGTNPMNSPNANYLDDDEATNGVNGTKYGLKYNGYCISEINSLLPDGWHVATSQDWDSIRSISDIGTKLKSTTGWTTNNGTDYYGFNGTPANGNGGSVNYWGNSNSDSKYSYSLNDTYYPSDVYYVGGYGLTSTAYIRLVKNLT